MTGPSQQSTRLINNSPYTERPEGVVLSLSKGSFEKHRFANQTFGTVRNNSY